MNEEQRKKAIDELSEIFIGLCVSNPEKARDLEKARKYWDSLTSLALVGVLCNARDRQSYL